MKLVDKFIALSEIKKMSDGMFGSFVKAVVDINKGIMVVDAALHADEEKYLLDIGSRQDDLWGINLYPDSTGDEFIEFDSMINLRPRLNNFSRDIENTEIRSKIIHIVNTLVKK